MAEVLNVNIRETRGKRNSRRMRAAGGIPAILYGHGKPSVSLRVPADKLMTALRHGSKLFELSGDVQENAIIREVQMDTFGIEVLHVDFTRVLASESVETTITVELRGEAPGTKEGGVIEHLLHEVRIECLVTEIPDKLEININALNLGESRTASQLSLPEGARLISEADTVIVQCVQPAVLPDEEGVSAEAAEPELIGRKPEEEEEGKAT